MENPEKAFIYAGLHDLKTVENSVEKKWKTVENFFNNLKTVENSVENSNNFDV